MLKSSIAIHLSRDFPHASDMVRCEDKLPKVAAYAAKRAMRIVRGKKGPESHTAE